MVVCRWETAYLDVVAFMAVAALAKQSMCDGLVNVQLVEDRIGVLERRWLRKHGVHVGGTYFAQTCGVHDDFVELAHPFEEKVDTRALEDVKVMPMVLDFDGDDKVGLLNGLPIERCSWQGTREDESTREREKD